MIWLGVDVVLLTRWFSARAGLFEHDLNAALRSVGSRSTSVVAVSSVPPTSGIEELVEAFAEHRATLDIDARRLRARRAGALTDFVIEHGERGLRALGGRGEAERWLDEQDPELDASSLLAALEAAASEREISR